MHTYETDFAAWADEQSQALAERRFGDLDLEHLVEEVGDLGGSDRRELKNRIVILTAHLLKWQFQPDLRTRSWFDTVVEQRESIEALLDDLPSLKPSVEEVTISAYPRAVKFTMKQTGLPRDTFPAECPYRFEELMTFPVPKDEAK